MSGNQSSRKILKGLRKETKQNKNINFNPLELVLKKSHEVFLKSGTRIDEGKAANGTDLSCEMEGLGRGRRGHLETGTQHHFQTVPRPLCLSPHATMSSSSFPGFPSLSLEQQKSLCEISDAWRKEDTIRFLITYLE